MYVILVRCIYIVNKNIKQNICLLSYSCDFSVMFLCIHNVCVGDSKVYSNTTAQSKEVNREFYVFHKRFMLDK